MLQESIMAEQIVGECYRFIAEKVKNGRIKDKFNKFADEDSEKHKKLLNDVLKSITGQYYTPDLSNLEPPVRVSSFSLIGALNMAKASENRAMIFYKKIRKKDKDRREIYDRIIKEDQEHWSAIDKEKRFIETREFYSEDRDVRMMALLLQTWR